MTSINGVPITKFRSPKIPEITVCRIRNTKVVVLLPENENPAGRRKRRSYYYKQEEEEEEKEKREEEEEVILPLLLTVPRISRSNLSWGGVIIVTFTSVAYMIICFGCIYYWNS